MNFKTALITASILAAFSTSAISAGFSVSPMLVDVSSAGKNKSTSIEVVNDNAEPLKLELNASAWKQVNNKDEYSDTEDLQFFPKVFEVKPGGKQTVKVIYKGKAPLEADAAYRLFFSEIKPPLKKDENQAGAVVQFAFRIGAGVFVGQDFKKNDAMSSSVKTTTEGTELTIKNEGNVRYAPTQSKIKFVKDGAEKTIDGPPTWHILPASEKQYILKDVSCVDLTNAKLVLDTTPERVLPITANCK